VVVSSPLLLLNNQYPAPSTQNSASLVPVPVFDVGRSMFNVHFFSSTLCPLPYALIFSLSHLLTFPPSFFSPHLPSVVFLLTFSSSFFTVRVSACPTCPVEGP